MLHCNLKTRWKITSELRFRAVVSEPQRAQTQSSCGNAGDLAPRRIASHCNCQTPPSYGFGRYGFGFFGPRIAFPATGALWGRATPFFYHFSVHLSSVLGRTELCHEVWTPGPQKPQIISNENHHLALFEIVQSLVLHLFVNLKTCSYICTLFAFEFIRIRITALE